MNRADRTTPMLASDTLRAWVATGVGTAASWSSQAAVFALIAVLLVTFNADLGRNPLIVVLGLAVVAAGWVRVIISFALAYLRDDTLHHGLEFPGSELQSWVDYVYLAVQVSTTFSTSDVTSVPPGYGGR